MKPAGPVAGEQRLLSGPDLSAILAAVRETAYRWDLRSDAIAWEANAASILTVSDKSALASGAGFHLLGIAVAERAVVCILRHVEIHAVIDLIRISLLF